MLRKFFCIACLALLAAGPVAHAANVSEEELVEKFHRYLNLYDNGTEDEFYSFASEYIAFLRENGQMEAYYKIKCNVGFYDMAHHHIYRAMQTATDLDQTVKRDHATNYYYLPTGLLGDVYKECHNVEKAYKLYLQALDEAGDRDPKYSIMKYMELAEMLAMSKPDEAMQWADRAQQQAEKLQNVEFQSMAMGMKGYYYFINGKKEEFEKLDKAYQALKSEGNKKFSLRFDNMMTVARLAFGGNLGEAERMAREENLHVDESLVLFRIYSMAGDAKKGFDVITRRFAELDSLYSVGQNANLDEVSTEMELVRSRQQAEDSKKSIRRIEKIFIGVTILYLFIYIMGRRRLVRKIWAKNRKLKEALDKAEESDRMKSAFIRNMSHEINTPLNAINGFSQLLCSTEFEVADSEKQNMKQRITENVEVISSIVNELLELSKGESQVSKTAVSPNAIGQDIVKNAETRNPKKLAITFQSDVADSFTFQSNGETITRILNHLMDNALKFTREGSVTLQCQRRDRQVVFTVTDTGIGIAADSQERIFENFVKLSEYTEGVGLGLPICRRLALLLGGNVELDSTYTNGSRFVLTLPEK